MVELRSSHLVEELQQDTENLDEIPVILDIDVWEVYEIGGGYDEKNGNHLVDLHIPQQCPGGAPPRPKADKIEIHAETCAFLLDVVAVAENEDDTGYTLRAVIDSYQRERYSFSEALREDIDKRHTRYEHE